MTRTTQRTKCTNMAAAALATAVMLHSLPAAFAQPNLEAPNRRPPTAGVDRRGDRRQSGFQPSGAILMMERVLTEEQRESLHAALDSQRDSMHNLEEKIRDARQALIKSSLAEKFNEDSIRAKALKVGKLEARLAVLRAKAMSGMQPPLSEEQIERISNPPPPRKIDGPPDGPRARPVLPQPDPQ